MNVYSIYDKVGEKIIGIFASPTDGLAIRENARAIGRIMPLGDAELRCIGTVNSDGSQIVPTESRVVDWDSYKFPESPLAPLSPQDSKQLSTGIKK